MKILADRDSIGKKSIKRVRWHDHPGHIRVPQKEQWYLISILFLAISCIPDAAKHSPQTKYKFNDLIKMVESEKDYYFKNNIQTNFKLDSIFNEQEFYHNVLIKSLENQKVISNFDKGFLIEDFMFRKEGKTLFSGLNYNYGAIAYFEDSINKSFVYIEISGNKKRVFFKKIELNPANCDLINDFMNTKISFKRINSINEYNTTTEQYLFISKLYDRESICQLVINPLWFNMLYAPNKGRSEDLFRLLSKISQLYDITGQGAPF